MYPFKSLLKGLINFPNTESFLDTTTSGKIEMIFYGRVTGDSVMINERARRIG